MSSLASFPACFCPRCQRLCAAFAGTLGETHHCGTPTRIIEAKLTVGRGNCDDKTTYYAEFFELDLPCIAGVDPEGPDLNDCEDAGFDWTELEWFDTSAECCIHATAEWGSADPYHCFNKGISVEFKHCDCSDASYIRANFGSSGGAGATWEETGGAAIDAFEALRQGGTICPKLIDQTVITFDPGGPVPPECEHLDGQPVCDFGIVGQRGSLLLRFVGGSLEGCP
jgi:hypothetical protein